MTFEDKFSSEELKQLATDKKTEKNLNKSSKQMNKFISMGSNSSLLLLSLIDDILDLSKMECGTFEINPTTFDLSSVIND
jgi:signal transduction histidine kinase